MLRADAFDLGTELAQLIGANQKEIDLNGNRQALMPALGNNEIEFHEAPSITQSWGEGEGREKSKRILAQRLRQRNPDL